MNPKPNPDQRNLDADVLSIWASMTPEERSDWLHEGHTIKYRRFISWLATLSAITIFVSLTIFSVLPPSPSAASRLALSFLGGYLIAIQIMSIRFFQDWHHEIRHSFPPAQ